MKGSVQIQTRFPIHFVIILLHRRIWRTFIRTVICLVSNILNMGWSVVLTCILFLPGLYFTFNYVSTTSELVKLRAMTTNVEEERLSPLSYLSADEA